MADQRKALADTTELTDIVYFLHPTRIQTLNPLVIKIDQDLVHKNVTNLEVWLSQYHFGIGILVLVFVTFRVVIGICCISKLATTQCNVTIPISTICLISIYRFKYFIQI